MRTARHRHPKQARSSQTPPPGSASKPGSSRIRPAASETATLYSAPSVDTDEDIGLAPLDDEEKSPNARQAKKAAASSGVLSDESGAKLGSKSSGSKEGKSSSDRPASAKSSTARSERGSSKSSPSNPASAGEGEAASLSSPSRAVKPKSIFDEEYAAPTDDDPIQRRAQRAAQAEYDPLHPPGYVNPYTKTPAWVYVVGVIFLLAVIGIVALVHNS